jgi:hypothetical protein
MSEQKRMIIWEQLALYLTAMPCPPMPLLVSEVSLKNNTKGAASSSTDTAAHNANSHDLIAALVLMAMDRGNKELNAQRQVKQLALNETLIRALEALPPDDNGEGAFAACQQFVGGYTDIHAFDDPGQPTPSVRLTGLDTVKRGDKVHSACCSWSAAQDIQHEANDVDRFLERSPSRSCWWSTRAGSLRRGRASASPACSLSGRSCSAVKPNGRHTL